ncbi:CIT [Branchiostoma lanceolatum]|uniref:non-specific serine/threonine protein kinase n=1 Tax=Branchiostoma lanceolatum TaxID=7740 RepID=A0A8J9YPN1_BRALA|nr:CIT [Branchiostoma lanceolatum]
MTKAQFSRIFAGIDQRKLKMSESKEEAISSRLVRLNQLIMGKGMPRTGSSVLPHRDALLDSFMVLLEECSSDVLVKENKHVSAFVRKFRNKAKEVQNMRPSLTDFETKTVIGRGHFGEVQLVRERCTGDMYAMKVLKKSDILSQESVAFFEEERDIMAKACSPWITSLQYAFQDTASLYLVMDFHPGGDLLNLLSRHDDVFEEKMAQFYLAEMVQALHCLHLMGYVHRDVKPDNILIDRTGHIKLADFGSAARISKQQTVEARMPVGTPDYIAPEVLMSMNGSSQDYGVGCDWWSLGVVAYEMLFGDTPFSDESVVKTYSNIMNHKVSLKFPGETRVSKEAKELIQCLCCESRDRLSYEEITCLPFFTRVDWSNLRDSVPPYVPVVGCEDDTSNFERFEPELRLPNVELFRSQRGQISGKDLPFVGFTFIKDLSGPLTRHRSTAAVNSPVSNALVEKRLVQKTRELQDLQEKCHQLETKEASLKNTLKKLESRLTEKDSLSTQMEMERDSIEKQLVDYVTEITNLKRCLELERNHLAQTDMKAIGLLEEVRQQGKLAQELQDQEFKAELSAHLQTISQLEHDRFVAARRAETLEIELRQEHDSFEASKQKVAELQAKVSKLTADSIAKTSELHEKLSEGFREKDAHQEKKEQELQTKIEFLENKLKMTEAKQCGGEQEAIRLREELSAQMLTTAEKKKLVSKLESKVQSLEDLVTELKKVQENKTELKKAEENRKQETQTRQKNQMDEVQHQNQQLAAQKRRLEEQARKCREAEEKLTLELKNKSSQLSEKTEMICQLESRLKVLNSRLTEQRKTEENRQTQAQRVSDLTQEKLYLESQKALLEEKISTGKKAEAKLRKELGEREMTISKQRDLQGQLESKVKVLESQLKEQQKTVKDKSQEAKSRQQQEKQFGEMKEENLYLTAAKARLEEQVLGCKEAEAGLREELNDKDSAISTHLESIGRLHSKMKVLEGEVKDLRKKEEDRNKESRFRQAKEELFTDMKQQKLYLETQKGQLETQKGQLEQQLLSSKNTQEKLQGEIRSLKDKLAESTDQYEKQLKGARKELSQAKADVSKDTAKSQTVEHLRTKLHIMEKELALERKTKEEKLAKLQSEKEDVEDSFNKLRDSCEVVTELEEQLKQMAEQCAFLECKHAQLEEQVQDMAEDRESAQGEIQQLKNSLTEQKQLCASQKVNIDVLKTTCTTLEEQIEALESLNEELEEKERGWQELKASLQKKSLSAETKLQDLEGQLRTEKLARSSAEEKLKKVTEAMETAISCHQQQLQNVTSNSCTVKSYLSNSVHVCTPYRSSAEEKLKKVTEAMETAISCHQQQLQTVTSSSCRVKSYLSNSIHVCTPYRSSAEEKLKKVTEAMETAISCHQQQLHSLQQHLQESDEQGRKFLQDLNESERKLAMIKLTNDGLQRKLAQEKSTNDRLTEENDKLQDQVTSLKATNFQLTQGLETAVERGEHLQTEKADLENQMEAILMTHSHESVKTMSTIAQQTKLIDFLQAKTDGTGKKKKVLGLFHKGKDAPATPAAMPLQYCPRAVPQGSLGCSTRVLGLFHKGKDAPATPAAMPLQYKELQQKLEQEKQRSSDLQQQITQLKAQLYSTISTRGTCSQGDRTMSEAQSTSVLSAIVMSPSQQPNSLKETHNTQTAPESPQGPTRGPKERMHHNIPHRFHTGISMRGAKCAVCLDTIHFGRQATKCHECKAVCHAKCAACLPSTCGLPSQFVEHFRMSVRRKKQKSAMNLSADDSMQMEGWLKVPRNNKMGWDKRWCTLQGCKLLVYDMDNKDRTLCDEFDLCPEDRTISIHSAVTAAELINTAKTDLPYIIKLESHPCTTCWPGRTLHLMALSFPDKQHWAAALEAAVSTDNMDQEGEEKHWAAALEAAVSTDSMDTDGEEKKLRGNILLKLDGDGRVDINSSLLLNDRTLLLGCEEGLFATTLPVSKKKGLTQLGGVGSVFQMLLLQEIDLMLMIAGPERLLYHVDLKHLRTKVAQASVSVPTIQTRAVEGLEGCHLFSVGKVDDCLYLCAATLNTLHVLKYNSKTNNFCKMQGIQTSETCSCVQFTSRGFIFGSDKFLHVNPMTGQVTEFLDKTDTSLAFAIFGASQCDSFPVAVLRVSPEDCAEEEYLLCFHEFGVFVDKSGRRSNAEDLKWTRLPLSFAYREPYLFVTHFNSLEVIEIKQTGVFESAGCRTFMELASPRYIGSAQAAGAIYLTSSTESRTEVLVLQGRHDNTRPENRRSTRGSKKRPHDENTPDDLSSKLARTASWSPSGDISVSGPLRRSARYSNTSSELSVSPSSRSSMSSVTAMLHSPCNPFTRSTRRRSHAAAKQDS